MGEMCDWCLNENEGKLYRNFVMADILSSIIKIIQIRIGGMGMRLISILPTARRPNGIEDDC